MRKIVLLKLGALGDILMATPAIRAYARSFPDDKINVITGITNQQAWANNAHVHNLLAVDDQAIYNGPVVPRMRAIGEILQYLWRIKPDAAFNLHRDWRFSLLLWLARVPARYGFQRDINGRFLTGTVAYDATQHEIDKYLALMSSFPGYRPDGRHMDVMPSESDRRTCEQLFAGRRHDMPVVAVVPGGALNSGMKMDSRRWPVDLFETLADRTISAGMLTVLIGGPSDRGYGDRIIGSLAPSKKGMLVDAIGKLTLQGSYCALQRCAAAVTSDCGPMHIAAAAGIPVVSIFGPTDPIEKLPLGNPDSHVFFARGQLPCMPCYREGDYPECKHQRCMRLITPDMVFERVRTIVQKKMS